MTLFIQTQPGNCDAITTQFKFNHYYKFRPLVLIKKLCWGFLFCFQFTAIYHNHNYNILSVKHVHRNCQDNQLRKKTWLLRSIEYNLHFSLKTSAENHNNTAIKIVAAMDILYRNFIG